MKLPGGRALVTGASRGIGAALADALAAEGCDVVRVSRTRDIRCDVADPAQVDALFRLTGPVDLLVNNAAVIHEPAPVVDVPLEEWERLFRVNVLGTVAMLRAYVPAMNARGSGLVLNLSSGWGRVAEARQAPYCATKFAVEALSSALAQEVSPGVVVLAVNPGVVATDMLAAGFGGDVSAYPSPARCAAAFVSMIRRVGPSWNGRSVDVFDYNSGA
ncbi:MAG: SDR family NAD(P)-dependent oxidoreductase [Planctomycetota bacterium]